MRKFLLLFSVVIASLAASAAATGNYFISGNFNGWDHAQIQFDKDGSTYSVTLDGTGLQPFSGEFLICGGTTGNADWTDKIGGVSNMVVDTEYTYQVGGGNCSVSGVIAYPLTVTFNTETKKIKITGVEAENDYDTVYVIGNFGDGWSETRTDGALSLKTGTNNVWEGDITFSGEENFFKLKAGAYIYGTGGADIEVELGEEYTLPQSGNAFTIGEGEYHIQFVLDKNAATGVLTVTNGNDPGPGPDPDPFTGWYFNIGGDFITGYWDGVAFPSTGIIEVKNVAIGTNEFKIKIWNGTDKADEFYSTTDGTIANATPTVLSESTVTTCALTVTGAVEGDIFDVKFDYNTKTLTVTKVGNAPVDPNPFQGWYFNFGTPSFEVDGENWFRGVAVPKTGIVEYGNVTLGTDIFKIKIWNGEDDVYYSTTDGTIQPNTPTVLVNEEGEMTVEGATAGSVYSVKYDCNTNTLTMTKVGGDEPENFEGWTFNMFVPSINGYRCIDVPETGIVDVRLGLDAGPTKVFIHNGTANTHYTSSNGVLVPGTPTTLVEGDAEMTIQGGQEGNSYDVKYDCRTNTITLTKVGGDDPEPEVPATLYLLGNFNETGWTPNNGKEMTRDGNVFTCETGIVSALGAEYGYFSFATQISDDPSNAGWDDVNSANRFGPAASDTPATVGQPLPFVTYEVNVNASSCPSWQITPSEEGKAYKFQMDFDNMTLTITTVAGVETINAEIEGTPVYYNLQGQRVENPANGVYVRVLNGKAEKIMK